MNRRTTTWPAAVGFGMAVAPIADSGDERASHRPASAAAQDVGGRQADVDALVIRPGLPCPTAQGDRASGERRAPVP